ncbi:MAG: nucleoside triphosphate pyrophosphohydrolase [Deltaproteobacteria bacterium]|nr:nucleoside triphosphate pyrophosphohydrolase [Deltaproteobacteria bacterium]
MTVKKQLDPALTSLREVVARLLGPAGCPWDLEQTPQSMKKHIIEEAYELCDAVDGLGGEGEHPVGPARSELASDAVDALSSELGDILLQVVFVSELAQSRGWFSLDDVSDRIVSKMVRRHPHVFGDTKADKSSEVLKNWEEIKAAERGKYALLEGLPKSMPALSYAQRAGEKVSRVGFDWPDLAGARRKLTEELGELDEAVALGDRAAMEAELGDVLFSVCNLARKAGLDAEGALRGSNRRFASRFASIEAMVSDAGEAISEQSEESFERLWQRAKAAERDRAKQ